MTGASDAAGDGESAAGASAGRAARARSASRMADGSEQPTETAVVHGSSRLWYPRSAKRGRDL